MAIGKVSGQSVLKWLKENPLMVATMCAVVLGIILGFSLRTLRPSDDVIMWIGIWGELFLRMLEMVILPLVVCSVVVGVSSMDYSSSGKLGGLTVLYVFITHFLAISVGAILVAIIKPGAGFGDVPPDGVVIQDASYTDIFTDLLRNIFPENIIQACFQSAYTSVEQESAQNSSRFLAENDTTHKTTKTIKYRNGMNMMGIVVFSTGLGMAICAAGSAGKPLFHLMVSFNHVVLKIMNAIYWYSPIGICSLITAALLKVDDIETILHSVGLFVGTVVSGCMVHQFVILPVIYLVVCRKNPFTFFFHIFDAYLVVFASCSSAVAMPYLLRRCPEKFGIDRRVAQCVLPLEVTMNCDGSALFIYVSTVFVAQSYSMTLSIGHQIMLIVLIELLVVAIAAVPSASIVVLLTVCATVGLPVDQQLGLFMTVEWFCDRVRSGTNIVSTSYGCAIIDRLCHKYSLIYNNNDLETEDRVRENPSIKEMADADHKLCNEVADGLLETIA